MHADAFEADFFVTWHDGQIPEEKLLPAARGKSTDHVLACRIMKDRMHDINARDTAAQRICREVTS